MKKILSLLVICIVLGGGGYYVWATQFNDGFSDIIKTSETSKIKLSSDIHSKTILLQNLSTGEMLIEKNETKEVEIASLTKLITAYLLLEAEANLEKTVTIDQRIIDDLMAEGASLSGYRSGD
ncbi:hypothetical protein ACODH7_00530, partial [Vagococcus fluvialis]